MKRSRACEDLVSLESAWTEPPNRVPKRSKTLCALSALAGDVSNEIDLESSLPWADNDESVDKYDRLTAGLDIACLDECLRLPRNQRQEVAEEQQLQADRALQSKRKTFVSSPESPEDVSLSPRGRILRDCYPLNSHLYDPLQALDGHRSPVSFDMSAFILLSISPKR